jgi:hypothetical protein
MTNSMTHVYFDDQQMENNTDTIINITTRNISLIYEFGIELGNLCSLYIIANLTNVY